MHLMALNVLPEPFLSRNLQGMILTRQHTPTTPFLLLPIAPMVPAQWVPWPWSSWGGLLASRELKPLTRLPLASLRSSWLRSAPVSMTATVAGELCSLGQALGAWMFCMPQSLERWGSLGGRGILISL